MDTPEETTEQEENVTEEQQPEQEDVQGGAEDSGSDTDQVQDDGWRKFAEERAVRRQREQERAKREQEQAEELRRLQTALGLNEPKNETAAEKQKRLDSLKDIDIPTGTDVESFVMSALDKWEEQRREREEAERQQRELKEYPKMLQRDHPDINDVVSQENLDYLEYHHPEIASIYSNLPDGYDKYSKLYSTIKKLVPQSRAHEANRARTNLAKPQAGTTGSAAPTTDVRGGVLSAEQKRANYERMLREMRGI